MWKSEVDSRKLKLQQKAFSNPQFVLSERTFSNMPRSRICLVVDGMRSRISLIVGGIRSRICLCSRRRCLVVGAWSPRIFIDFDIRWKICELQKLKLTYLGLLSLLDFYVVVLKEWIWTCAGYSRHKLKTGVGMSSATREVHFRPVKAPNSRRIFTEDRPT